MRAGLLKTVSVVLVPAVLALAMPAVCAGEEISLDRPGFRSDESSEGAMITVGLLGVCLGVLLLVNLKMDIDNVFSRHEPPARKAEVDESLVRRLELTVGVPRMGSQGSSGETRVAEAVGLGLSVDF